MTASHGEYYAAQSVSFEPPIPVERLVDAVAQISADFPEESTPILPDPDGEFRLGEDANFPFSDINIKTVPELHEGWQGQPVQQVIIESTDWQTPPDRVSSQEQSQLRYDSVRTYAEFLIDAVNKPDSVK